MLDTDTCSDITKRTDAAVIDRLKATPVGDTCISVITQAELLYGVEVSSRQVTDSTAVAAFLTFMAVMDFTRECSRVPDLSLENWTLPASR